MMWYDDTFKIGAMRLVTEQGRQLVKVAKELETCIDTLRSWLKTARIQMGQVSRINRDRQRIRKLEAEFNSLRKQICGKGKAIDIIKIRRHPVETAEERYYHVQTLHRQGAFGEPVCRALESRAATIIDVNAPFPKECPQSSVKATPDRIA